MWTKIKARIESWWHRMSDEAEEETVDISNIQPQTYTITGTVATNVMTLTGQSGKEIFAIDADGNAIWYDETSYDEAAETFLNAIGWQIESKSGIQQSRMEWEERITQRLIEAAESRGGSIKAEELTDVIRKCIMYDKLKGKYGNS